MRRVGEAAPGGGERLCAAFPTRFARYQGHHGIGHGLLVAEGYDLPRATEICRRLRTLTAQRACLEGVFTSSTTRACAGWRRRAGPRPPRSWGRASAASDGTSPA